MPAIELGAAPARSARGCKRLTPQQHTQGPLLHATHLSLLLRADRGQYPLQYRGG